jgi:hypothetical protein
MLAACKLYFPSPLGFNDPFDCRALPEFQRGSDRKWKKKWTEWLVKMNPGMNQLEARAHILLAYAFSRVAAGLLIGISPTDPVAFLATPPLLALVALASI